MRVPERGRGKRAAVASLRRSMTPSSVAIVLSPGRCGTQWLAATLGELYGDRLEAEHEPLGALYRPRRYFRRYDDPAAILEVERVREHFDRIERTDRYIETGWPLYGAAPLFAERYADRLRVVHL